MMQQRVAPAAAPLVLRPHGLDLDEQLLLRSQTNTCEQTAAAADRERESTRVTDLLMMSLLDQLLRVFQVPDQSVLRQTETQA